MTRFTLCAAFTALLASGACSSPNDEIEMVQHGLTVRNLHTVRTVTHPNGAAVTLGAWHCRNETPTSSITVTCPVDPDYVVVGGGAHTNTEGPGAMLYASHPELGLTNWTASSKEHGAPHPHVLHVFAHGIKVKNMTRDQLLNYVTRTVRTSEPASHPALLASPVPSDMLHLSTGARLSWVGGPGSLLVGIWPNEVKGKDHEFPTQSTITSYEIRIKKSLPVGTVDVRETRADSDWVDSGFAYSGGARVLDNFVEVGAFAYSTWYNPGRLLVGHGYTFGRSPMVGYEARSKDHLFPARGAVSSLMTMMRVY